MTKQLKPKRPKWFRVLLCSVTIFVAPVCAGVVYFYWKSFHPAGAIPIVGPAGSKYRAFIDDRSFQDIALIVCASDWPHTFRGPFSLGDAYFPQAYSSTKIFWSADGSVLAFRVVHLGEDAEVYEAAYDFREHAPLQYRDERITALIHSRGGLGPQFSNFSERKGD